MNSKIWKNNAIKAWVAVAILVIIAIITSISLSSGSPKDPGGDDNAAEPDPTVVDILTVTSVTEKCATTTDHNVVKYDVGALKGTPPRKWSDAISTPLSGGLDDIKSAICHDPLLGVTVANMLAGLTVDGVSVQSLNPWLSPYKGASKINDRAAGFAPLLDVAHPSDAQVEKAITKNHDYQLLANQVNTLLSRFKVSGKHTLTSVKNWHLKGGGLKVGGLPEVGLDSRHDAKKALILEVTLKNACAPVVRIGFNVGDKRPEVFKTPTCKTPNTTCKSNCTPNQGCKSNCTPSSGCKHDCTPPPGCKHDCTPPPPPCDHCVKPTDVVQPVPTPDPGPSGVPTHEPSAQPTKPANPSNPAPPTPGGYNGGSTQQPGQTAPPTPVVPSSDPTNTGDPGGF